MSYEGFRITNPRLIDGMLTVDMAHEDGAKFTLQLSPKVLVLLAAQQVANEQERQAGSMMSLPPVKKPSGKSN